MKNKFLIIFIIPIIFLLMPACESSSSGDELDPDKAVTLSGQVINAETSDPIVQATIVVILSAAQHYGTTDQDGLFEINFELEEAEQLYLISSQVSYIPDTLSIIATPGSTYDNLQLELATTSQTVLPSGEAASIILAGVEPASIGVRESGSEEVAAITFIVQDSTGTPVDANHIININFYLGGSPGGGLFLTPASAQTNSRGEATTYLFSGDSAGVVQIIAVVNQPGVPIQSRPIAIAIHGGFPHEDHFGIAFNPLNIPGLILYGVKSQVTAYLGDKYGNPVKSETNVYFTTTGGIVEGSATTDALGQAVAELISAEPNDPIDPIYGPGFAEVTARTVNENQNTIEISGHVLFSGGPIIILNDTNIDIPNGGSQSFSFDVSDINGNPLCAGQTISISIEAGSVKTIGETSFTMEDTQSKGATHFGFTLEDAEPDTIYTNSVHISIGTAGPNGKIARLISGTAE